MSLIVLYFLYSTSVLSFYIDVVLTLSITNNLSHVFNHLLIIMVSYIKKTKQKHTLCSRNEYTSKSLVAVSAIYTQVDRIRQTNQGPVPLTLFRPNSKFDQNSQCPGLKKYQPITTKFVVDG